MAIWNDAFLLTPEDEANPGRGATAIREFKGAVEERLKLDHYWGEVGEALKTGGYHKEGSAIVKILDEDQTARNTELSRVERTSIGTLEVDMNLMTEGGGSYREEAGVDVDAEGGDYDNRRKVVKVWFKDSALAESFVEVFDPDKYMHVSWDQTVGGDKIFGNAVQAPPDDDSDAVTAVAESFAATGPLYATEYLVPAEIFWKWLHNAKFHNDFDVLDSDNDESTTAVAGVHGAVYIDRDISANVIEGEIVRGAVWG